MADDPERKINDLKGDPWLHAPLPYVVRVRVAMGDDAVPQTSDHRLWAYSVMEAGIQAIFEAAGELDQGRAKIESVAPDMPAYFAAVQHYELMKEAFRARRG